MAGDILGLLDIAIINDNIVEETEVFNLIINASSLPERVFAGNPNNTIINILDSDGKANNITILKLHQLFLYLVAMIRFNQMVYNITEDAGLIQPTLVLSRLLLTDITVNISSTNINATGNCSQEYQKAVSTGAKENLCIKHKNPHARVPGGLVSHKSTFNRINYSCYIGLK